MNLFEEEREMKHFAKVRIYAEGKPCFDDIQKSKKPFVTINLDLVSYIEPVEYWGFCTGYENYPFRKLVMSDGHCFYCIPESANELEKKMLYDGNIKWRKREERGYDNEQGLCQMAGVGYVVYDETHYISWEDLEKLPREL